MTYVCASTSWGVLYRGQGPGTRRHHPGDVENTSVSQLGVWGMYRTISISMNIYQLVIWEHDVKKPSVEAFMEREEARRNVQNTYF